MEEKIKRKYNTQFRKNLKQKFIKLFDKNDYFQVYKIISNDLNDKLSINRNGIYFNLNLLSDTSIDNILLIIKNKEDNETITETTKIKYEIYNKDNNIETFIQDNKLSNQEKSLIKKFRQKNIN